MNLAERLFFQTAVVAVNSIGAFLSDSAVFDSTFFSLKYHPQIESNQSLFLGDTAGWLKISGVYEAQGGEQYITLGNFYLSVKKLLCLPAGRQVSVLLRQPFGSAQDNPKMEITKIILLCKKQNLYIVILKLNLCLIVVLF